MRYFTQWASREYSFPQRLLVTLAAGVFFALLIPYLLVEFVPRLDPLIRIPRFSFGIANIIIGCILVLVSGFFALWSIFAQLFQARGTPVPMMATKILLVSGPFKLCRNPMAFGAIFVYVGIGIIVGSVSSILLVLIFAALLITYIKLVEERELEARFGQAYLGYKATTPLIIPRIIPRKL